MKGLVVFALLVANGVAIAALIDLLGISGTGAGLAVFLIGNFAACAYALRERKKS